MFDDDDEALTWAGDKPDRVGARPRLSTSTKAPHADSASAGVQPKNSRRKSSSDASAHGPRADDASADGTSSDEASADSSARHPRQLSNWEFVLYGVFGGIYLLYSIAWLVTLLNNPLQIADPLGNTMFVEGLLLAICAPTLWFVGVFALGRHWSAWWRFTWLVAGALILIPWPYISWVV